jgi:hypothetical protein
MNRFFHLQLLQAEYFAAMDALGAHFSLGSLCSKCNATYDPDECTSDCEGYNRLAAEIRMRSRRLEQMRICRD